MLMTKESQRTTMEFSTPKTFLHLARRVHIIRVMHFKPRAARDYLM